MVPACFAAGLQYEELTPGTWPDGQAFDGQIFVRAIPGAPHAAVAAPEIGGVTRTDDDGIRFGWVTAPGVTYRVEAAASIEGAVWVRLAEEVATGATMTYSDRLADGVRFTASPCRDHRQPRVPSQDSGVLPSPGSAAIKCGPGGGRPLLHGDRCRRV